MAKWKPKEVYRAIVLILDGVGDRPLEELGGLTPLQAAIKPTLDFIAREGVTGLMDPIAPGVRPGTDTGHLAIFGYDPYRYYPGRGPLEAAGIGVKLRPGDVAVRCNLATVKKEGDGFVVVDRRAGRIRGRDVEELVKALNEAIGEVRGVKVEFYPATEHRVVLVLRGSGLSARVSDSDPGAGMEGSKVLEVRPLEQSREAEFTAELMNEVIRRSYEVLHDHPVNRRRAEQGLLPANIIITRGAGQVPHGLRPFPEVFSVKGYVVAEEATVVGIARLLGMEAEIPPGATGNLDTNFDSIASAALKAYNSGYDVVFIHVKGPDIAGHDMNYMGKVRVIEQADAMMARILDSIDLSTTVVAITADHSTPCRVRDHSGDPVPIAVMAPHARRDPVDSYDEVSCARGALCRIRGVDFMPIVLNLMNRPLKYGK